MRGVKLEGNGSVVLSEMPEPSPGPGEVLIETAVSAVCGSELHAYRGDGNESGNAGHEGVGTVIARGEGVTNLAVGERVGASAIAGCGACSFCKEGRYTWCGSHRFYGNMHAEKFLASADACYRLPDDISWEAGVLLCGDGFGVPYHTSLKIEPKNCNIVAIFGVGPIGLGNVILQRYLGRELIAVDISATRLEMARTLGAGKIINASNEDAVEKIRSLTGGAGADVCIEAAGKEETALACFKAVRTAGTVIFNGEQGPVPLSPSDHFIRRDVTAIGSWFYHFCEIGPMMKLYRDGLSVTSLITHRFSHLDVATAYAEFAAGRTGKVILDWTDDTR
jgi:threonine dehydrogenase-like Zn-dependent dehydrogenase